MSTTPPPQNPTHPPRRPVSDRLTNAYTTVHTRLMALDSKTDDPEIKDRDPRAGDVERAV